MRGRVERKSFSEQKAAGDNARKKRATLFSGPRFFFFLIVAIVPCAVRFHFASNSAFSYQIIFVCQPNRVIIAVNRKSLRSSILSLNLPKLFPKANH